MAKFDFNDKEDVKKLKEELNKIFESKIEKLELESALNELSSQPFGAIKNVFEGITDKLYESAAGKKIIAKYVKSIREGKASLVDSYCYFDQKGELWLKNSYIAKYKDGTYLNHEERRERKLLITSKQARSLREEAKKPGQTIVPIKMFVDDNTHGKCKVLIALAKGKREFDKRESIKDKDMRRESQRREE